MIFGPLVMPRNHLAHFYLFSSILFGFKTWLKHFVLWEAFLNISGSHWSVFTFLISRVMLYRIYSSVFLWGCQLLEDHDLVFFILIPSHETSYPGSSAMFGKGSGVRIFREWEQTALWMEPRDDKCFAVYEAVQHKNYLRDLTRTKEKRSSPGTLLIFLHQPDTSKCGIIICLDCYTHLNLWELCDYLVNICPMAKL